MTERWSGTGLPPADYHSHIGWGRVAWATEGYHIEGPYLQRRTINAGTAAPAKVYFFGGSTIWGTGVPDAATVPSQFAARTGFHSENRGRCAKCYESISRGCFGHPQQEIRLSWPAT